jgi:hypothetical protein
LWIGNKVKNEHRECAIELTIGERQFACIALPCVDLAVRGPFTDGLDEQRFESIASTDAMSSRAQTANERLPVPQPTSSTRLPATSPAKSKNRGASRWLQGPM